MISPNYKNDFASFEGKIWLNCASEGPLPNISKQAVLEALQWKQKPFYLTHKRFSEVPQKLKAVIARLMTVKAEDVILGNSATYGIHLLANGIPFKKNDEIILMQNDFPTDILPWLALQKKGVVVKQVRPQEYVLTPEEILKAITPQTKLICLAHVHTFSGHVVDIEKIGRICKKKKIIFVVNFSQSLGTYPINLTELPVDAMTTAGFKWLLGPYGTGFCWMKSELRARLEYNHTFWVSMLGVKELESEEKLELPALETARTYDVFGTANFFNFCPFTTSIEYLLNIGIEAIQQHNEMLVDFMVKNFDNKKYYLISPSKEKIRSTLVVFSHTEKEKNRKIFSFLKKEGIYLAIWKGNLRVSAHIYNTLEEVKRLVDILNNLG